MRSRVIAWLGPSWLKAGKAFTVGILLCLGLTPGASGQRQLHKDAPDPPPLATHALPTTAPVPAGKISCPPSSDGAQDFLTCEYAVRYAIPEMASMTFYLYLPRGYDPTQSYPLVLLLHGVGESAQSNLSLEQNRDVLLTDEYASVWGPGYPNYGDPSVQDHWPCFVVVPQVVSPNRWVNVPSSKGTYQLLAQPSQSLLMAVEIVELLQRQYTSIDANRLYVTGISMGAFGVWDAIERWPSLFAAAVPVSGAGDPDPAFVARIVRISLWDFHGGDDTLVPVEGSQEMIAALQAAGGHPCYTEIPGIGHSIWGQVYGISQNPDNPLYPWLFAQRKGGSPTSPAACVANSGILTGQS